jgi:hypothetical protein
MLPKTDSLHLSREGGNIRKKAELSGNAFNYQWFEKAGRQLGWFRNFGGLKPAF